MITIRNATETDIPAIFSVRTSVRENHLSIGQMAALGITQQTIREAMQHSPCIWVAETEGEIVGFSMASREEACLFAVFVRPDWAGQGIGRCLTEHAEAYLFEHHASIWLHTDRTSRAAGFYERLGWVRVRDVSDGKARFEKHRHEPAGRCNTAGPSVDKAKN